MYFLIFEWFLAELEGLEVIIPQTYFLDQFNHLHWLQTLITSKRIKLESPAWSQIEAFEKCFSKVMYFLIFDWVLAELERLEVISP